MEVSLTIRWVGKDMNRDDCLVEFTCLSTVHAVIAVLRHTPTATDAEDAGSY